MNLYEKINAIMGEVESLQKDGKVSFGTTKYNFLSEAKTTAIFHEKFVAHKLVMLPIYVEEKINGSVTHGIYKYKLVNAENPEEFIELMAAGQGHDSSDKGSGKASSYAYKYLLWRSFAIPSNDDPDNMSSDQNAEAEREAELLRITKIKPIHVAEIKRLVEVTGADEQGMLTFVEADSIEDMNLEQFQKARKALEKKAKK